MLKLYIQDHGYRGMIVVIADSEESARQLMTNAYNYEKNHEVIVEDIKDGFWWYNLGDS